MLLATVAAVAVLAAAGGGDLVSPCPEVFRYQSDAGTGLWGGTLRLAGPKAVSSVRVLLDRAAVALRLPYHPQAIVDTYDDTEFLVSGLQLTTPLSLHLQVEYTGSPPPKVTAIRVNEVTVCFPKPDLVTQPPTESSLMEAVPSWALVTSKPSSTGHPKVKCGTRVPEATPLIVEGSPSRRGEWPWHAALYASELGQLRYQCGASLVTARHVVTAAHCVTHGQRRGQARDPGELLLVLGRQRLSRWGAPGEQQVDVAEVRVFPGYNATNFHCDLAVLRLGRRLRLDVWVRPICLWHTPPGTDTAPPPTHRPATVVGWGFDASGAVSDRLQHVVVSVIDQLQCISADPYFYPHYITPTSFCAGNPGKGGACNGDSGGGLVLQDDSGADVWVLRGVVSLSASKADGATCDVGHYAVFTDVAHYEHWLRQQTADV